MNDTLPPIDYSTFIAAEPSVVFEALTTGEGWDAWFTSRADIAPDRYRFQWIAFGADRTDMTLEGPVVEWVPDRVFAFDWGSGEGMTRVRFTVEARGEGTVVRVTETGYSTSTVDVLACLDCASGWGEALTLLKFWLEHGVRYGEVPPPA